MNKLFFIFFFVFFAVSGLLDASESEIVYDDSFTQYKHDSSIYKSALPHIEEMGLKAEDLLKMELPKNWYNQWAFFPENCTYEKSEDGFRIHSPSGLLYLIHMPHLKFTDSKYIVTLDAENVSAEQSAEIRLECIDFSMLCADKTVVKTCNLDSNTRRVLTYEFSCRDGFVKVCPALEVKGDLVLHRFRIEAVPEPGVTCLEGTIVERSELPDPATTNYPDCRYTIQFNGNAVLAGEPCRREIALTIDGFRNKKLLKTNTLKKGDKIICSVIPFADLPEKMQETQVADDLNLFHLDSYYVLSVDKIAEFSAPQSHFKAENQNYTSVFERHVNPPIPEELALAQQAQILQDLAKMNRLLEGYPENIAQLNTAFNQAWETEKAKDANGYNRVAYNSIPLVWRNVDSSFWCLRENHSFITKYPDVSEDKINALVAMKRFLEANGVQFIVSVVPNLYDIAARVINPEFRKVPDYKTATIVRQLLRAGIETVYASDEIIANYNRYPFAFFYPYNSHPADTAQDVLAEMMAKRLERYCFTPNLDRAKLKKVPADHVYSNSATQSFMYLFPKNCDIGDNQPGTAFQCNSVEYDGKPLPNDKDSQVLVIGNSFIQTPMNSPNSYPDLLAFYSAYSVENRRNDDLGPVTVLLQNFFTDPVTYLTGKKVVILQMGEEPFRRLSFWNNLEYMDHFQMTVVGKNVVKTLVPADASNAYIAPENAADQHAFLCAKDTETTLVTVDCSSMDPSKPIVCYLPYCASPELTASMHCNGQTQPVPVLSRLNHTWSQVLFELPIGTKEITLSVSGPENAVILLQEICLLQ